jgi:hypothetical protein
MGFALAAMAFVSRPALAAECDATYEGVDLSVQAVKYWIDGDGVPMISYAIRNRGTTPSTSFDVTLLVNGARTAVHEDHPRGLHPGKIWRWAFDLAAIDLADDELELGVRVDTAASIGAVADAYVDHCPDNNLRVVRVTRSSSIAVAVIDPPLVPGSE